MLAETSILASLSSPASGRPWVSTQAYFRAMSSGMFSRSFTTGSRRDNRSAKTTIQHAFLPWSHALFIAIHILFNLQGDRKAKFYNVGLTLRGQAGKGLWPGFASLNKIYQIFALIIIRFSSNT